MKIKEAFIGYRETGKSSRRQTMANAKAVVAYMREAFEDRVDQEQLWVILLDSKLRAIARQCVFIGTLDCVTIHPREIFRIAVLAAASSLIVVHNHPSGDPAPSPQDMLVTQTLNEAGKVLGIQLTDHVIVGRRLDDPKRVGYFSFQTGG